MITFEQKYKVVTDRLDKIIELLSNQSPPQKESVSELAQKGVYVTKEMLAKAFEIQWYANSEDMNESLKVMASYLGFPND